MYASERFRRRKLMMAMMTRLVMMMMMMGEVKMRYLSDPLTDGLLAQRPTSVLLV